eukprot:12089423-Alexandrium_andersonii.AAC.1
MRQALEEELAGLGHSRYIVGGDWNCEPKEADPWELAGRLDAVLVAPPAHTCLTHQASRALGFFLVGRESAED